MHMASLDAPFYCACHGLLDSLHQLPICIQRSARNVQTWTMHVISKLKNMVIAKLRVQRDHISMIKASSVRHETRTKDHLNNDH